MLKCYARSSMKGCSLEPDPNVTEARTDVGLIRGHAYSITKVCFLNKFQIICSMRLTQPLTINLIDNIFSPRL